MGFWRRLASRVGLTKDPTDDGFRNLVGDFWGYGSATGIHVNQAVAMQASAVMACVTLLAEAVAKMPVHVYRPLGDGGQRIASDHWLDMLLQQPNGWQNRFEWIEQMQAALILRGNAYAAILRNGRGQATSLVPLNPDRVSLFEAPGGELFYWVARTGLHELAVLESLPMLVPAEDMFHLRWQSMNSLTGLSRIGLIREAIGLSVVQERQAARFAANGARLGGVLQTDSLLSDDALRRLKADWKAKHGGSDNSGETAILEQGLKWQPLGMTSVDAEFLASRQFQVEEIARAFGVPPYKIGVTQSRSSGSTMTQQDQDFMNNVITSYVERWEAKINQVFGLNQTGVFVQFDVNRFLRADMATRYNANRTAIIGMWKTPNEVRADEGLSAVDGGDTLYQPVNVAPIGFVPASGSEMGAGPGSDVTGAPAAGGRGDPAAVADPSEG